MNDLLDRAAAEAEADALMVQSVLVRRLLWGLGAAFFGIGMVGVVLPLLPTTPFLLLSAALWARSSRRFYVWLLIHRTLGPPIASYRRHGCIPRHAKVAALSLMAVTFTLSVVFVVPVLAGKITLVVSGAAVGTWIARLPTCPPGGASVDGRAGG